MDDFWVWTKWFFICLLFLTSLYVLLYKSLSEFWDGLEVESLEE